MGLLLSLLDDDAQIFKPLYGTHMVCCFGAIGGHALGVIANNGPIDVDAAHKTCQFIDRCTVRKIPLLFVMNTTGFQVGRAYESAGIIKAGSRLVQYMSNADVPKITLQIGAGFGAGYYAMCGRSFSPDVVLSWPNANVAVMGAKVVADLMVSIKAKKIQKQGKVFSSKQKKALHDKFFQRYEKRSASLHVSAQGFDDGIIRPEDTQSVLFFWLSVFAHSKTLHLPEHRFGLSRV